MAVFNNILAGAAGQAGGAPAAYEIERSLRFNSDDSAYLNRTPSSAGNRRTYTFSFWLKKGSLDTTSQQRIFNCGPYTSGTGYRSFNITIASGSGSPFYIWDYSNSYQITLQATAAFRDPSSWYHIIYVVDTTQSVASDRVKLYINGSEYTDGWVANTYPSQNYETAVGVAEEMRIGTRENKTSEFLDAYLADFYYVDGQALAPTDFGEFDDNGVWQPIEYTGTYGTNGFHLDFSDASSASALGADSSGNGNDWTVNNLSVNEVNYANGTTNAVNGVIPNGGDPYWIDFLPTNADLDYDAGTTGMQRVHDGSTATEVYWVGSQYSTGNVLRARFDLRDYPTITSLRVFGGFSTNYVNYDYQLLDSSKTPISGTSGTFGAVGWHSLTILGSPRYLEISTTSGNQHRHRLYAIEVNGTVLVNGNPANNDSFFDSPTNGTQEDTGAGGEVSGNYATLNPLDFAMTAGSISNFVTNGNLTKTDVLNTYGKVRATMPVHFGGKTYFEVTVSGAPTGADYIGFEPSDKAIVSANGFSSGDLGFRATGYKSPGGASYGSAWSSGDVLGFYFDDETSGGIVGYYLNGVDQGTAWSGFDQSKKYLIAIQDWSNGATAVFDFNFGQRPFAYSAPSGFKALCTANLDDPTIADGSTAMDVALYTGNGSTQSISGLEFSPDFVWIKTRSVVNGSHALFDVVRGATNVLKSQSTDAEGTFVNSLTSFDADGFSVGSEGFSNYNTANLVAWTWDAGTSTASNTDGSITSSVRANPSAGFSIVTYTGTGSNGTVGHGLSAAPSMVVVKDRDASQPWIVGHESIGFTKYLWLNSTNAAASLSTVWQNTAPTSTVFSIGTTGGVNTSSEDYVAYCFAPVEGYSAFGSYTGNGSTDGLFVYTGFRPRFLLFKRSSTTSDWVIMDTAVNSYNVAQNYLRPNLSNGENTLTGLDIVSNGFKFRTSAFPNDSSTYIYAAFAESPQKYARAR